ncbi:MAG TPA: nucleotidyltransferase family protein [Candidatus Limnocylindria bacterium]|nr:nucleotidyltransferase family protein [Candidatus Limnocylindria bacterium]
MTASAGRHAVILAGGKGTRLRPFTITLPKPLVPIGDESSVLEIVIRQLAHQGFDSATLAIGHFGELIEAYVGDGTRWGMSIDFAREEEPLGTMGPVVQAADRLPEHFLVLNGDTLTDLDYARFLDAHAASGAPITVATARREARIEFGVLDVEDGRVVGFREKPAIPYTVAIGAYALSRATLERYPAGQALGFDRLMLDLIARGEHPASYDFGGLWLDIGRPEDYDRANVEFDEIRARLLPNP